MNKETLKEKAKKILLSLRNVRKGNKSKESAISVLRKLRNS